MPYKIIKYLYNNYPTVNYIGEGKTEKKELVLYFDNFDEEAKLKLFEKFKGKIIIGVAISNYAPEEKKGCIIIKKRGVKKWKIREFTFTHFIKRKITT